MNRATHYIELLDSLDAWRQEHSANRWPDVNNLLLEVETHMLDRIKEMTLEQWKEEQS